MFVSSGILQIPGEECAITSRNVIIYMMIIALESFSVTDTAYIFEVI